ncbi:MAG: serine/threonine protein kinase [Planctomycetes bacterium]|nr:serine/threonine protein kinase [Planctomycetota bacterium]
MGSGTNLRRLAEQVCGEKQLSLDALVGEGTFKQTYRAADASGNIIALKVHRPELTSERVNRELEAMQRCSHPSVGRLIDVGVSRADEQPFLWSIEPFCAGGTLAEAVQGGAIPRARLVEIGGHLVSAIEHIAGLGLVHRDIKPDNIMFSEVHGTPVIVDFGLVRDLNAVSLTASWQMRGPGTPLYASPEQLNNDKLLIDWRSDQFSLAVTLFVSGFGFHPFLEDGEQPVQAIDRVANRNALPARARSLLAGSGLTTLARMLSPHPVSRFRKPAALLQAWNEL